MKAATVTTYGYLNSRSVVCINNGLSMGHHLLQPTDDYFTRINTDSSHLSPLLKNYDIIYTSMFCTLELKHLQNIIDERWIIGGPAVRVIRDFSLEVPCRTTMKTIPEYLGVEDPLLKFTPYFQRLMKIYPKKRGDIVLSFGSRCYWDKCRFCSFSSDCRPMIKGNQVPILLDQVERLTPKYNINIATPAITPKQLEAFMNYKRTSDHLYKVYLIPSRKNIELLEKYDKGLENTHIIIGMEAANENNRNLLNKGFSNQDIIDATKNIMRLGANIELTVMTGHFNTKKEDVEESRQFISELEKTIEVKRMSVFVANDNLVIRWPLRSKQFLEENTDFPIVQLDGWDVGGYLSCYHVDIPQDSDVYKYNKEIEYIINTSKLCTIPIDKPTNFLDEEFNL